MLSLPEGCSVLKAGQTLVAREAEIVTLTSKNQALTFENQSLRDANEEIERENALLIERLFNLRIDTLIQTAFTPEGLKDHLEHDNEIQEELRGMQWGVVRLDGRFVNYINRFGNSVGDDFLQSGGAEITSITDGLVRTYSRRAEMPTPPPEIDKRQDQRRQGHSLAYDIICRQGGDEFSLIIRNVNPGQLALVAGRIQAKLTVPQALERYAQGGVPFIASVGYSHASDFAPEVRGKLSRGRVWQAFKQVNDQADEGQRHTKSRQYEEMWGIAYHSMPADSRPLTVARPDDRTVAEEFLRWTCPDFMENPMRFLTDQSEA